MSETKRLIKNTALIALGNFGAKFLIFILLPVYTDLLTPQEFGLFDFVTTLSLFLIPIVSVSAYESMFRFVIEAEEDLHKEVVITSTCVLILVAVLGYALVSAIIYRFTHISYLPVLTVYVIANILFNMMLATLRGFGEIKLYALYSGVRNLLQVALSYFAVAHWGMGIYGMLNATIVVSVIIVVVAVFQCRLFRFIKFDQVSWRQIGELLKFSLPLIPNNVSASVIQVFDRVIVRTFIGDTANGIYSISQKFPTILETVNQFFYLAWNESASRSLDRGSDATLGYYQQTYRTLKRFLHSGVLVLYCSPEKRPKTCGDKL